MKRSDRFIEWMKDWFVYESMKNKEGQVQILRFYPLPTRRFAINVIYFDYDGFHNHLWNFVSFILYGGYKESIGLKQRLRKPLSFGYIKHSYFHKIVLISDKSISLMIRGKDNKKLTTYLVDGKQINEVKYWMNKGYTRDDLLESMQGHLPRKWKMPKFMVEIVDKHRNPIDREKYKKKT